MTTNRLFRHFAWAFVVRRQDVSQQIILCRVYIPEDSLLFMYTAEDNLLRDILSSRNERPSKVPQQPVGGHETR